MPQVIMRLDFICITFHAIFCVCVLFGASFLPAALTFARIALLYYVRSYWAIDDNDNDDDENDTRI